MGSTIGILGHCPQPVCYRDSRKNNVSYVEPIIVFSLCTVNFENFGKVTMANEVSVASWLDLEARESEKAM